MSCLELRLIKLKLEHVLTQSKKRRAFSSRQVDSISKSIDQLPPKVIPKWKIQIYLLGAQNNNNPEFADIAYKKLQTAHAILNRHNILQQYLHSIENATGVRETLDVELHQIIDNAVVGYGGEKVGFYDFLTRYKFWARDAVKVLDMIHHTTNDQDGIVPAAEQYFSWLSDNRETIRIDVREDVMDNETLVANGLHYLSRVNEDTPKKLVDRTIKNQNLMFEYGFLYDPDIDKEI